ncbi:MAG: hypothetical protein J6M53_09860 [Bacteroidaceae bacterium]|nr:hypothetical protein [Bacteroidaceae bacterium]
MQRYDAESVSPSVTVGTRRETERTYSALHSPECTLKACPTNADRTIRALGLSLPSNVVVSGAGTTLKRISFFTFYLLLFTCLPLQAQDALYRCRENVTYELQGQVSTAIHNNPLWLQANRHGLSSVKNQNGYAMAGVFREAAMDSDYVWRIGYGAQVAVAYGFTSIPVINQLYADIHAGRFTLSVGSKQRPMELKNTRLSSGSQTLGINARPVPQVRFEVQDWWNVVPRWKWLAVKGHFGYGALTDTWFEDSYLKSGQHHVRFPLYHSKAGYIRLGDARKFPLTLEGGLEWATLFGGSAKNISDVPGNNEKKGYGPMGFVKAIYGGGSDASDGIYGNAAGNSLGSWTMRLTAYPGQWKVSAYADHFFEDHSGLFLEYGWRDALIGLEVTPPRNPFVTSAVYEYITTKNQSGAVYHDHTEAVPDQISAADNYYNHDSYSGWMHWGQPVGNPLYYTGLYRDDGTLYISGNRFNGHHVGFEGNPTERLSWRLLFSHTKSWGTYARPYAEPRRNSSLMAEVTLQPKLQPRATYLDYKKRRADLLRGWAVTAAFAFDRGTALGNNTGIQLTLTKRGLLH